MKQSQISKSIFNLVCCLVSETYRIPVIVIKSKLMRHKMHKNVVLVKYKHLVEANDGRRFLLQMIEGDSYCMNHENNRLHLNSQ
jgi:hypothetical protein